MRYTIKVETVHYDEDNEKLTIVLPNGRMVETHSPRNQMSRAMEQAKILDQSNG
jgi:hypothetical protein